MPSPREILEDLFRAAIAAADPASALITQLEKTRIDNAGRLFLLAVGKASPEMAQAALGWSKDKGKPISGGIVVSADLVSQHRPNIRYVLGDHPVPGENSLAGADGVDKVTRELRTEDEVWVLLSGGTSSLIGAPVPGVTQADYATLFQLLLDSGLDIEAMNLVRKRVSRWGAGRLALALSPARVRVFAISDVPGDDLATIGSGPCAPDPSSASDLRTLLNSRSLWHRMPDSVARYVDEVMAGMRGETPKFDDPRFSRVHSRIMANNLTALEGVVARAGELGLAGVNEGVVEGDATLAGRKIADHLVAAAQSGRTGCFVWGGETTVTLETPESGPHRISRPGRPRSGGRCQDLALSAAIRLSESGLGGRVTLMAAGTDGRDGPTDAAGAIVDGTTAAAVGNPRDHLDRHDAYPALKRAKALIVTGPTGTNVMDVVIGLVTGDR
jgi:glycerate 2-kinase